MPTATDTLVSVPRGMPTFRWQAPKQAALPPEMNGEIPLLDPKKDGPAKGVQEVWIAHVRVFNLTDETQRTEYEAIWQGVCNGQCKISEHLVNFVPEKGTYVAFLRWSTFEYKVPPA